MKLQNITKFCTLWACQQQYINNSAHILCHYEYLYTVTKSHYLHGEFDSSFFFCFAFFGLYGTGQTRNVYPQFFRVLMELLEYNTGSDSVKRRLMVEKEWKLIF